MGGSVIEVSENSHGEFVMLIRGTDINVPMIGADTGGNAAM
jgi:hypothetical protein